MSVVPFIRRAQTPPTPEEALAMSFANKIQIIVLCRPVAAQAIERFLDRLLRDIEGLPPQPAS